MVNLSVYIHFAAMFGGEKKPSNFGKLWFHTQKNWQEVRYTCERICIISHITCSFLDTLKYFVITHSNSKQIDQKKTVQSVNRLLTAFDDFQIKQRPWTAPSFPPIKKALDVELLNNNFTLWKRAVWFLSARRNSVICL